MPGIEPSEVARTRPEPPGRQSGGLSAATGHTGFLHSTDISAHRPERPRGTMAFRDVLASVPRATSTGEPTLNPRVPILGLPKALSTKLSKRGQRVVAFVEPVGPDGGIEPCSSANFPLARDLQKTPMTWPAERMAKLTGARYVTMCGGKSRFMATLQPPPGRERLDRGGLSFMHCDFPFVGSRLWREVATGWTAGLTPAHVPAQEG